MLTWFALYVVSAYAIVWLLIRDVVSSGSRSLSRSMATMTIFLAPAVLPMLAIGYPMTVMLFAAEKYLFGCEDTKYVFRFWRNV